MTGPEAAQAMARLLSEWRYPELDRPGQLAWEAHLGEWSYADFTAALAVMVRSGNWPRFRPEPSAVYESIRTVARRRHLDTPPELTPPALPPDVRRQVRETEMVRIRQTLAEASARLNDRRTP